MKEETMGKNIFSNKAFAKAFAEKGKTTTSVVEEGSVTGETTGDSSVTITTKDGKTEVVEKNPNGDITIGNISIK